ncbi:MAG: hypothetical protein Q8N23_12990 [Archangium sp.]|nr:hypothetical protein [Archangium sp.]MDP3569346.1 hypothetical protein [Archangium sp.]
MSSAKTWMLVSMLGLVPTALAEANDEHAGHHPSGPAKLTLNAGKKWQTDATLRTGMITIRDQVQAALPGVHSGKYTKENYLALATSIEGALNTVISQCKLPPDADAQLHLVLADLLAGTATMKAERNRMAGVVKVIGALKGYGEFFDHPEWKPVVH